MLIIFEGVDLVGKTTIANFLGNHLKFPVVYPRIYRSACKAFCYFGLYHSA